MLNAKTIVQCERFLHAFAVAHLVEMTGGEERERGCVATALQWPKQILRRAACAAAQNDIAVGRAIGLVM